MYQHQLRVLVDVLTRSTCRSTSRRDRDVPVESLGGFLALRAPNAGDLQRSLLARGMFTDSRADILCAGPAPYLCDDQLGAAMTLLGEVARGSWS